MGERKPQNMMRVLSGPLAGATFEVGDRLLIGRVPACDVILADVEVSREHAMIVSDNGKPTLVDLASSNGTLIDGKKIKRAVLHPGTTFTISTSEFVFDHAPPVETRPILAAQFGDEAVHARPTKETPLAEPTAVSVNERPTRQSLAAIRPSEEASVASRRSTIQLEAAVSEVGESERSTVEIRAVEAVPEPPVFSPPPAPMPTKPEPPATPSKVVGRVGPSSHKDGYPGDLLGDITDYRGFRLRLQRGEIPTGEEVAAMIDMEALLREPPAESSPRRDVVTQRFFRRFAYSAELSARFAVGRDVFEVKGTIKNLSVDGLQCVIDFGSFNPEPNQLAMLVVDQTRGFLDVRYSITARIVYRRKDMAGFVFAGVPSWAERGEFQHAETAVARSGPDAD